MVALTVGGVTGSLEDGLLRTTAFGRGSDSGRAVASGTVEGSATGGVGDGAPAGAVGWPASGTFGCGAGRGVTGAFGRASDVSIVDTRDPVRVARTA